MDIDTKQIKLKRSFEDETYSGAEYSAGSVPFGVRLMVRVPTSLMILRENAKMLNNT